MDKNTNGKTDENAIAAVLDNLLATLDMMERLETRSREASAAIEAAAKAAGEGLDQKTIDAVITMAGRVLDTAAKAADAADDAKRGDGAKFRMAFLAAIEAFIGPAREMEAELAATSAKIRARGERTPTDGQAPVTDDLARAFGGAEFPNGADDIRNARVNNPAFDAEGN